MEQTHAWIDRLARAGYAARGLVYAIIGVFAILAAFGGGDEKDSEGALRTLLGQPFGQALVWAMIVGLAGYVIWRLVQAIFDADRHGRDAKGLAVRAALLVSAFTYTTLAIYALSLLGVWSGGGGGDGGGGGAGPVASTIAGFVGARWVSLGLALIFSGVAIAHWRKAATRKYEEHFKTAEAPMALVHPVSIIGLTARGVVFAVIAVLLFSRGFASGGSADTPGLEAALEYVRGLPFGDWLLALLGLGLVAFAAYSAAEARWRRIELGAGRLSEPRRGRRAPAQQNGQRDTEHPDGLYWSDGPEAKSCRPAAVLCQGMG